MSVLWTGFWRPKRLELFALRIVLIDFSVDRFSSTLSDKPFRWHDVKDVAGPSKRDISMTHYNYDLFVIGAGSGGIRTVHMGLWGQGGCRGRALFRRHLRQCRLRTQKTIGLRGSIQ